MLFWRLFQSVILITYLNYRKSCLLSTMSPFLLSSNVCLWMLKSDLGNLSKKFQVVSTNVYYNSDLYFRWKERYNVIWAPLVKLTTFEPGFNSVTFPNSAWICLDHFELSATTKRQQTEWRIKFVKCEDLTTKRKSVIVNTSLISIFKFRSNLAKQYESRIRAQEEIGAKGDTIDAI